MEAESSPGDSSERGSDDVSHQDTPSDARILVCEDDDLCARLLKRLLSHEGYQVDVASNAAQAKDMLTEGDYEAMTLDLALPDQDGVELLHEIRSNPSTADLPVIVVSATADVEHEHLSGDAIAVADWLSKPIANTDLRDAVQRAVQTTRRDLPRVLHVEDDPLFRKVVTQILSEHFETIHAGTLAEARKKLMEDDDFDLVLLDLTLPDGLGAELLPFLTRPDSPPTPVLIVSADEATDALAAHVAGTLVKSQMTEDELVSTIKRQLEG